MARVKLLNVREHLKHLQEVIECYEKYGDCPIFKSELKKLSLVNRAILRKHEITRDEGNRKDIYIESARGHDRQS